MNDQQFKDQKKRVESLIRKWFKPIGMGWWQVDFHYERERSEQDSTTIGMTTSNWQYRTGDITFFLPTCAEIEDHKLEEAIVHELTHILVAPLQDVSSDASRDITEFTVTSIARALIWSSQLIDRPKK